MNVYPGKTKKGEEKKQTKTCSSNLSVLRFQCLWAGTREEGGGVWNEAERASPTHTNRWSGGSWVVFVNTHCGLILCTLYLLRTLYVGPLRALLLGCPTLPVPPLSPSFLSKTVVKMLFLPLITSLSSPLQSSNITLLSPGIHILQSLQLTAVSPPPAFLSLSSFLHLFTTDSDQLWHYASRSVSLHGLCPSGSDLWPTGFSDTLFKCFTPSAGCRTSQALSQSKNPNI